ncbi:uncharacterized protein L201_008068 [Kwoniella dendrophila CBS 6074]|uniref:2'-phosphotransferase n=1 Tax=Kwoniella dendrophila CBS 6074 TaxID=1295534 RepID=A0AAX4K8B9_9TREE
MPRPPETPDVKASKGLAYILRHGAEKEGLHIRSDGYIKLNDVLARPKMREVDLQMVLRLVEENSKKRFELLFGYDPSSPLPKKLKKGQQPKKKRPEKPSSTSQIPIDSGSGSVIDEKTSFENVEIKSDGLNPILLQNDNKKGMDAAEIDNLQSNLSNINLIKNDEPLKHVELPLISLPIPDVDVDENTREKQTDSSSSIKGEYFIRATQGHSINLEGTSHLEELIDYNNEESIKKAGIMVHGTKFELWDILKTNGLSKMTRQHIHLAPSHKGQIVPRLNSTLYIYLSLKTLIENNIKVFISSNGVVLSPGIGENGIIPKELWRKVVKIKNKQRIVIWENGKEIEEEGGQRIEQPGEEGI